jgi:hypothetical protein
VVKTAARDLLLVASFGIIATILCVPVASAQSEGITPRYEVGAQVEWPQCMHRDAEDEDADTES